MGDVLRKIDLIVIGRWQFRTAKEEENAIGRGQFGASNADFLPLANASGNVTRSAGSLVELADVLREVFAPPDVRLSSLGILTHSDGINLLLSGDLLADEPYYFVRQSLSPRKVRTVLRSHVADVLKDKISPDAKITLYGCHTGSHLVPSDLLEAFAVTFEVDCFGFKKGLETCFKIDPKQHRITDRGWIRVEDGSRRKGKNCASIGFVRKLTDLVPDASRPFIRVR